MNTFCMYTSNSLSPSIPYSGIWSLEDDFNSCMPMIRDITSLSSNDIETLSKDDVDAGSSDI